MRNNDLINNKSINNSGFDNSTNSSTGRVVDKKGRANVRKSGVSIFKQISLYHTLLEMPWWKFVLTWVLFFLFVNGSFACVYYILGPDNISVSPEYSGLYAYLFCFFFSVQTITTVGYGGLHPESIAAGAVSSVEAFIGLILFAVLTGLVYGRFSRPRAFLIFSKNALISPFKEGKALMFRLASYKNATLTDIEAEVILSIRTTQNGKQVNNFFPLSLELKKINALALNWTLVHPITPESPLATMTQKDYEEGDIEIVVFIKAFDEHFSNIVKRQHSYHYSEIVHNAKFDIMFRQSDDKTHTVLELDKINDYKLLD